MFLRSPLGRLLSGLVLVAAGAALYFGVVRGLAGTTGSSPGGGSTSKAAGKAQFGKALRAFRDAAGDPAQLLEVQIGASSIDFKYPKGDAAAGYRYTTGSGSLDPVTVKIVGGGSVRDSAFPASFAQEGVPERLAHEIARLEPGAEPVAMTLGPVPGRDTVGWTVVAETKTRTSLTFIAKPDGSGVEDVQDTISATESKAACIQRAGTDVEALKRC